MIKRYVNNKISSFLCKKCVRSKLIMQLLVIKVRKCTDKETMHLEVI